MPPQKSLPTRLHLNLISRSTLSNFLRNPPSHLLRSILGRNSQSALILKLKKNANRKIFQRRWEYILLIVVFAAFGVMCVVPMVQKYSGSDLSESDLDILRSPSYLSDQIIWFYFSHFSSIIESEDVLFIHPAVSDLIANTDSVDVVKGSVSPLELGTKTLILLAVNDCNHWSLLVYDRNLNEFLHHDSMAPANSMQAEKLYHVLKDYVAPSKSKSSGKPKKNRSQKASATSSSAAASPSFRECATPQQTNGYDCGLFVLAIARALCNWHCTKKKSKVDYWFKHKQVDPSMVENSMRTELMNLVTSLRD